MSVGNDEVLLKLKELLKLNVFNDENTNRKLNDILDELNTGKQNKNKYEDLEQILFLIFKILQPSGNEHLLSKFFHFLYTLKSKEKVPFSEDCIIACVDFSLRSLTVSREWVLPEILNTLSLFLHENVGLLQNFWYLLVGEDGILIRTFERSQFETETHIGTLKCLQNICLRRGNENYLTEDYCGPIVSCFYETLKKIFILPYDPKNILRIKTLLAALYGLKNLIIGWKCVPSNLFGELLGIMKCLISFGLKEREGQLKFSCLYPTSIDVVLPQVVKGEINHISQEKANSKRKNRKKRGNAVKRADNSVVGTSKDETQCKLHRDVLECHYDTFETSFGGVASNCLPWMYSSSSESEYSDSERSHTAKIKHNQTKVRYCAYKVMQAVNWVTDKKIMFGYFTSLIPDYSSEYEKFSDDNSILSSMLNDPSPQVRLAAVAFVTDLLNGTKIYMAVANERNSKIRSNASFIPISIVLSGAIRELHKTLSQALCKEVSSSLLTQILKCFSILVDNSPYHRLNDGLLQSAVNEIPKILQNKDVQVQVACWTFIGSLTRIRDSIHDMESFFFNGVYDRNAKPKATEPCWLISHLHSVIVRQIEGTKLPTTVLLEMLQVLTSFIPNYYTMCKKSFPRVIEIINVCIKDSDSSIQFHGIKVFEAICKCLLDERTNIEGAELRENVSLSLEIWIEFLKGPFFDSLLQHPTNHSIRSLCCDCLSNIGNEVFELLPRHSQVLCVSVLLGLVNDESYNVKGAAVRCLGIFTLYSSMNDTVTFLMDVGDVIKQLLEDSNYNTCLKASWALGNLSDALLLKKEDILELIPNSFIYLLGSSALRVNKTQDNIKIRANIVRAIGNLLNYIPATSLGDEQITIFIKDAMRLLLGCLEKSMMKVQWNACYALGVMLQNEKLINSNIINLEDIFVHLIQIIRTSKNFKVKINAISSLCGIKERSLYKDQFYNIWQCLLESLTVIEENVDFREINHRDSLCLQICLSMAHFISILTIGDVALLNEQFISYEELIMTVVTKYCSQIPNDKVPSVTNYQKIFEELSISLSCDKELNLSKNILDRFFQTLLMVN